MKNLICLLIVAIFVGGICSAAFAENGEILFRDIPWGSNVPNVLSRLPKYAASCDFDCEKRITSWESNLIEIGCVGNGVIPAVYYYGDLQVAGYKVECIVLKFLYSVSENGSVLRTKSDMQLICAEYVLQVADGSAAYSDLVNKLTELYGDGITDTNEYGSEIVKWMGSNGTGLRLEVSDDYIVVLYGIDSTSQIENIDVAIAKEEAENVKGKSDGL